MSRVLLGDISLEDVLALQADHEHGQRAGMRPKAKRFGAHEGAGVALWAPNVGFNRGGHGRGGHRRLKSRHERVNRQARQRETVAASREPACDAGLLSDRREDVRFVSVVDERASC